MRSIGGDLVVNKCYWIEQYGFSFGELEPSLLFVCPCIRVLASLNDTLLKLYPLVYLNNMHDHRSNNGKERLPNLLLSRCTRQRCPSQGVLPSWFWYGHVAIFPMMTYTR